MSKFILKEENKQRKFLCIVFFLIVIFFLAVGIWYSPIIFKGYSPTGISKETVLARNYFQGGILADQNDLNIVLSSNLIKEEGHPLVLSEHLGSFFYAQIFKIIGIPNYNNLILTSIILYALALILFTILILYLFNFKTAIIFSLVYIFSPLGWELSQRLGGYEFCLIFWALFFIFYFIGARKVEHSRNNFNNLFFVVSGIFLTLSALSKEVTFVFALAFFIFLAVKKLKSQMVYIFVPFVILLIIFWAPSVVSGENRYLSHLLGSKASEESIFSVYGHVFPDSYTYYFEKEEFLEKFKGQDLGLIENLETKKVLTNFGFGGINLFERIKVGFYILTKHAFRFFSLQEFGGPFILLLFVLGLVYLKRKYKFLYSLSLYWVIISIFIFSFIILVSRSHLMDFILPIILGISLGLIYIFNIVKDYFQIKNKKALMLEIIVIVLVLYNLLLINHVVLGDKYDKNLMPRSITYAREIKKFDIKDTETIIIPGDFPGQENTLNYLIDKSFVIFRSSTLEELIKEEKIQEVFDVFKVKYILGYSDELSDQLVENTEVINIAANSLKVNIEETSENKSFLMNLIR